MSRPPRETSPQQASTGKAELELLKMQAEAMKRQAEATIEQSRSIDRQTNFSFLLKDFEKVYDVYLYSHSERSESIKMFLTLLTVPFVSLSIFGWATRINPADNTLEALIKSFPNWVFWLFLLVGAAGLVPFHRFVAAHCNSYKMMRYMNNYRLLYFQFLKDDINDLKWRSVIEKDPRHPKATLNLHWTSIFSVIVCATNTLYMCIGVYYSDGAQSSWTYIAFSVFISIILHGLIVWSEIKTADLDRLKIFHVPVDALLKNIDNEVK
ncbi:hypothetical protein [Agrobacterium bohemicum]|uniref:Uncharacterized protein n=1 Tax=Agrobacterium bohemicum TaxID=2052828 RepID=A0A135P850_9HYPH|nr:hypothetical protein [Agrobacterium bohemicum]KXG87602.1 hypothetical protein ATO67_18315 [Agrobacterium bohemicum]